MDTKTNTLVGWLIVLGSTALETVFQSISNRLHEEGRKKREMIDERKNVQTTPPAPTVSAVGPCPTIIQISRTSIKQSLVALKQSTLQKNVLILCVYDKS